MRVFIKISLLLPLIFGCSGPSEDTNPPNILIILTDDQGYGDVGYYGNEVLETPTLDRLSNESVVFDRFYVSPVCAPTRASLLTGRYHLSTGVSWVTHRREVMNQQEETLAELLRPYGYRTGLFGKWHNGYQYPHDPTGQGFEEFLGFKEGHFNNYFDADLIDGLQKVSSKGYVPDVITDRAIDFISREERFLAMVTFNTPHSPFQVPDEYFEKYKNRGLDDRTACIYGMIENIDDNVARLLQALKATGKEENTLVVFLSDNGPNGVRYNAGLKGIKAHVDEGGVRVPCLMRLPSAGWKGGLHVSTLAGHIDLFPTVAKLVDPDYKIDPKVHGKDLAPVIAGGDYPDRYFFTHQVVRKLDTIPGAVRYKNYVLTLKGDGRALYDLNADPGQKINIADSLQGLRDQLEQVYYAWVRGSLGTLEGPPPIEVGHPHVPEILFPAPEVVEYEGARFEGEMGWANDYFIDFEVGGSCTWDFQTVSTSEYEVKVQLVGGNGSLLAMQIAGQKTQYRLSENFRKSKVASPDRVKRGEVYEYRWPEVTFGRVELTPGFNQLTLTCLEATGLEIKSVTLKKL